MYRTITPGLRLTSQVAKIRNVLSRSLFTTHHACLPVLQELEVSRSQPFPFSRTAKGKKLLSFLTKDSKIEDSWPGVLSALTNDPEIRKKLPRSVDHLKFAMETNARGGKMIRSRAVLSTMLAINQDASIDDLIVAHGVGWALDTLQGSYVIADDIMDGSKTRRNNICWHLRPEVGILATNDVLSLNTACYEILEIFASESPAFPGILRLVNKFNRNTILGECMDVQFNATPGQQPDLDKFNWENFCNILHHKTGYYTFVIPVQVGYLLAGLKDEQMYAESEKILLDIAVFYQIQDDYMDCFGDPVKSGKIGRDIEEGKLCWPILFALARCSKDQRNQLVNIYGKDDPVASAQVKELYTTMGIHEEFKEVEKKEHARLLREISLLCQKFPVIPEKVFTEILNRLFKRVR